MVKSVVYNFQVAEEAIKRRAFGIIGKLENQFRGGKNASVERKGMEIMPNGKVTNCSCILSTSTYSLDIRDYRPFGIFPGGDSDISPGLKAGANI
jgi:hypothetical protein